MGTYVSLAKMNYLIGGSLDKGEVLGILADNNVGKTTYLCSEAMHQLRYEYKVLFITFETMVSVIDEKIHDNLEGNVNYLIIKSINNIKILDLDKIISSLEIIPDFIFIDNLPSKILEGNDKMNLLKDIATKYSTRIIFSESHPQINYNMFNKDKYYSVGYVFYLMRPHDGLFLFLPIKTRSEYYHIDNYNFSENYNFSDSFLAGYDVVSSRLYNL